MHLHWLSIALGLAALRNTGARPTQGPIARTQQGDVRGTHLSDAVDGFLGVPYAQPPTGDLSFRPPQPLAACNASGPAVRDASRFGPVCHQFHYRSVLLDNLQESSGASEDCLNLNVFIPRDRGASDCLPVLVWMPGGAFGEGAASAPAYVPSNLVASQSDIIVVTLNYRTTIFGFPNSPALDSKSQNLGIRDMRAALEWLRDNLAAFGGDPARITLGGQSAGADAAAALTYQYPDDPIASALLLESGQPLAIGSYDSSEFFRVAGAAGCRNASDSAAELQCMRDVPAVTLNRAISNRTQNSFGSPAGGGPMIDNTTLFSAKEYSRRGQAGEFARLPMLIGMTDNEGDGTLNWSPKCGVNKTLADIFTLSFFECPITLEASYRTNHSVPVWRYRYMGVFPAVTFFPWARSYHGAEVPMLLGSYPDFTPRKVIDSQEAAAARMLQDAVGVFVRNPERGLRDKLGWPTYDQNGPTLIELFPNNTATTRLQDPKVYNMNCATIPPPPVDQFISPPPSC